MLVTRKISMFDHFGRLEADIAEDAASFGFQIIDTETLLADDVYDVRFTATGEPASLDAYAEHYELEWDDE